MPSDRTKSYPALRQSGNVVVRNVRLDSQQNLYTITIIEGVVASIERNDHPTADIDITEDMLCIDADSALAIPGLIDLYTRLREPGFTRKGTISSECAAARRAGFTQLVCTPDTQPVIDNVATVELIRQRVATHAAGLQVTPMAALTIDLAGDQLTELATLQAAGCPVASQADMPIASTTVLYSAMEYAASFNMPLLMTARDAQLGIDGCAHAGAVSTRLGLPQIPVAAEAVELARLIELCRETGCAVHISRISSARAVHQVDEAKQAGLPISCDVGIHHLFFTDDLLDGFDASFHSAVPFRGKLDRQALRDGLRNGIIDAICTDHAPHDKDAGLAPFPGTEPGLSAYDWFIPLLLQLPTAVGLSFQEIIRRLTEIPSELVNGQAHHGLKVGETANFFLLADQLPATPEALHQTSDKPLVDPSLPDTIPTAASSAYEEVLFSTGTNNPLMHHSPESLGLQALQGRVMATFTGSGLTTYQPGLEAGHQVAR